MTDATQEDFIADLNAWTHRGHIQFVTLFLGIVALAVVAWATGSLYSSGATAAVAAATLAIARLVESRRRRYHLEYDLGNSAARHFAEASRRVAQLAKSARLDSVRLEHIHGDWKRNAGATVSVHSDTAHLDFGHPRLLSSNLSLPPVRLHAQGKTVCFLPDRLLVEERGRFAAVSYEQLDVDCAPTTMRWYSRVPSDAEEVGRSWHKVNRNGTPDRRFTENRQIPILLFAELSLASPTGLHVVLQASNTGAAGAAASGLVAFKTPPRESPPYPFESARMLAAAGSWRDLSIKDFTHAFGRDVGSVDGPARLLLPRLVGGLRDVLNEFDSCAARTLRGFAPAADEPRRALAEIRASTLRQITSVLRQVVEQLRPQPAATWGQTADYIASLVVDPDRVLAFTPDQLQLPSNVD